MQGRTGKRAAAGVLAGLLTALCALFMMASVAGAADAPSTVVGQWRFDDGSGQIARDDGPYGLDGRLGASTAADAADPSWVGGASGGALRFSGQSYVRLPAAAELAPATLAVEAVVRADQSPGQFRYVVSRGAQACFAGSYGLYTAADGGLAFYVFDGSSYTVSAALAPGDVWNGAWHHAVGMYDGQNVRLYLDGRPVGDPVAVPDGVAYGLTSNDGYFGTYQGSCGLPLTGDVDLVRIWRGGLSPAFVAALSDGALGGGGTGSTPPTVTPPTATPQDSDASAPQVRPGITPIAPGQHLPAVGAPTGATGSKSAPGAPPRSCVITPSVKTLRVGRTTSVSVRVLYRGKAFAAAKVVVRDKKSNKKLGSAKTAKDGRVRVKVKPSRSGTVTVAVWGRGDCAKVALTAKAIKKTK